MCTVTVLISLHQGAVLVCVMYVSSVFPKKPLKNVCDTVMCVNHAYVVDVACMSLKSSLTCASSLSYSYG